MSKPPISQALRARRPDALREDHRVYCYDVAPGQLVETEKPIDENQLADARDRLARGQKLTSIATRLGGRVYEPETSPVARVAVDQDELERLLEHAYPEEADRERIRAELLNRG